MVKYLLSYQHSIYDCEKRKGELRVGLFSANYNKPGPGVDKDAPPKPRFFIFFEVLKRKFWHLLRVNMMFVLFNIPALLAAFFIAEVYLQRIKFDAGGIGDFYLRLFLAALLTLMPVIAFGPVQAGFTYILRNYSREEHSFIWWDFKETFVKNFKQGMAITVIDFAVMYILGLAINFYAGQNGLIFTAATSFVSLSLVIFVIMHLYIYPMLVTVDLSIKNIYKNAFIFAILKFLPNLLFFILNIAIAYAAFFNVLIGCILYIFLLPSFIGLMNNFYVNPIIKKYVVTQTAQLEEEDDEEEDDGEGFYKKDYEEEGNRAESDDSEEK